MILMNSGHFANQIFMLSWGTLSTCKFMLFGTDFTDDTVSFMVIGIEEPQFLSQTILRRGISHVIGGVVTFESGQRDNPIISWAV